MRYRSKLGRVRAATWIAYGVVAGTDLSGRRLSAWLALGVAVLTSLLFLPGYFLTYWEILPDRLVERRLFSRSVLMHFEIVALNPLSVASGDDESVPEHVEVRGVAGRRMLVETSDARGFLEEMLEHLPPIPKPIPS
jgi:hypothetical protein